ncbi:MAG TPA: hypothetical protein VEY95_09290 [Azospirillaceae bacterium]|nr:hypothetical protein [Azospirillaceae bacterium]
MDETKAVAVAAVRAARLVGAPEYVAFEAAMVAVRTRDPALGLREAAQRVKDAMSSMPTPARSRQPAGVDC